MNHPINFRAPSNDALVEAVVDQVVTPQETIEGQQRNRYSVALNGNPVKDENKNLVRKPVALNGNPAVGNKSEPDLHCVIELTSEGRPCSIMITRSGTLITRLDVFPLSLFGSTPSVQSQQENSLISPLQALLYGSFKTHRSCREGYEGLVSNFYEDLYKADDEWKRWAETCWPFDVEFELEGVKGVLAKCPGSL